jgi:hypothetical protein
VRREQGCLGALPPVTRALLGLRAGLDGAPLSRPDAAARLDIPRSTAARLERGGLRALHSACAGGGGSSSSSSPTRLVALAAGAPTLQPAVFLPASNAPSLRPASDLSKPRGSGGVKDATSSSPGSGSGSGSGSSGGSGGGSSVLPAASSTSAASGSANWAILLALCLAALGGALLITLRRRAVVASRVRSATALDTPPPARVRARPPAVPPATPTPPAAPPIATTAAKAAQPVAPAPKPSVTAPPSPASPVSPPAPTAAQPSPRGARLKRSASVVATGLLSVAARELVRRRRRGR